MFKENHNNIINLILEGSITLKNIYEELKANLPIKIIKQCQKEIEFEDEIDNIIYSLESLKNGEKWEFKSEDINTGSNFTLEFKEFNQKEIEIIEKKDTNYTCKLAKFNFETGRNEKSYIFELIKNENNDFMCWKSKRKIFYRCN